MSTEIDLSNYPLVGQIVGILIFVAFCVVLHSAYKKKTPLPVVLVVAPLLLVSSVLAWDIDHITKLTSKYFSIETNLATARGDVQEIENIKNQVKVDELAISQTADDVKRVGAAADAIEQKNEAASAKIVTLDRNITSVQSASKRLDQITGLLTTAVLAISDDRAAYMKLQSLWLQPDYFFRDVAGAAFQAAGEAVVTLPLDYPVPWASNVDPRKFDLGELVAVYNSARSLVPNIRCGLVQYVEARKDLPKKPTLEFFLEVIDTDPSLKVAVYAARAFADLAGISHGTVDLTTYDDWWRANSTKLK